MKIQGGEKNNIIQHLFLKNSFYTQNFSAFKVEF